MLSRINDFSQWFNLPQKEVAIVQESARVAASRADGMTHYQDYLALGACLLALKPGKIFEIGTYLGLTSNFFLEVLPDSEVISIAYVNPPRLFGSRLFGRDRFNNSELRKSRVGSLIEPAHRPRFKQLFGDSHQLRAEEMLNRFGAFDLVFIDGDHTLEGVRQDTQLALSVLAPDGAICWHDANPKERYQEVRDFLENMPRLALATRSDYVGGVACWQPEIEKTLKEAMGSG